MGQPIESVTIVGGGTAGWLAAALLQSIAAGRPGRTKPLQITVIESPNIPTIGVGEATVPGMVRTLRTIGLSEREFMKRCNASFKLGVVFDNWNEDPDGNPISYINPFNRAPSLHGVDLCHFYQRFGANGLSFVQCYAPTHGLLDACKGPRVTSEKEFESFMAFAYHLDAARFAELLTEKCVAAGVRHIRQNVKGVEQDENGYITALALEESGRHPVELVIDCTGFRGLIINQVLGEPFIDYSRYLANDRAMAVQIAHPDPERIEPCTRSTALGAGWCWRVPLFNRVGTGYVYSSAHRSDDAARDEFLAHLGPQAGDAEPRVIPMRIGRNRNAWVKNCVALGLAGGFIEPLESTAIHMIDMGVRWLVTYFPDSDYADPLRDRYNRLIDNLYDEVRDFICLHYRLGNRTDTQYWIDAREELDLPDRLAENIELWRHNMPAHYDLEFSSLFSVSTYNAVLLGKQVYRTGFARAELGGGLALNEAEWRQILAEFQKRNAAMTERAMNHHRLLAELRGDVEPAARPASAQATRKRPPGVAPYAGPQPTVAMPGFAPPRLDLPQVAPAAKAAKHDKTEDASLL